MPQSPGSGAPSTPSGNSTSLLKIVAGLTAVISLGLAIRQVVVYVTEYREKKARLTALVETSRIQANGGDYPAAWASLNQALRTEPDNRVARQAKEDVAQAWLEHSRTGGNIPTLTALADTVSPVLTQGLLKADSTRKADLLAHLGWADFLRWREGDRALEPSARYHASLEIDPRNPYALAMVGHWVVWQELGRDTAKAYFANALAVGRAHEYVRGMQIAAWSNRRTDYSSIELLRIANEMRTAGEPVADGRDHFWDAYSQVLWSPSQSLIPGELTSAVPASDLLTTYKWAFAGTGYPDAQKIQYQGMLAQLQELSGDKEEAIKGYRAILAERDLSYSVHDRIATALARLKAR